MPVSRRLAAALGLFGLAAAGATAAARAIYPQLQTKLSGAELGGCVPEGDAKGDQSRQPHAPGRLAVRVRNVNLSDGTSLAVNLGGDFPGGGVDVGTIVLRGGAGRLSTTLQFAVGRPDPIAVMHGATVVLSGGAPWSV